MVTTVTMVACDDDNYKYNSSVIITNRETLVKHLHRQVQQNFAGISLLFYCQSIQVNMILKKCFLATSRCAYAHNSNVTYSSGLQIIADWRWKYFMFSSHFMMRMFLLNCVLSSALMNNVQSNPIYYHKLVSINHNRSNHLPIISSKQVSHKQIVTVSWILI